MRALKLRFLTLFIVFSLVLSLGFAAATTASAENTVISKILTTLSSTPVALDLPSSITAATSTPGCYIVSAGWYDAGGKIMTEAFSPETYSLVMIVGASSGYTISQDVACYLNNSAISCSVDASGSFATLTRDYTAAVWAPTIYKNPGNETVDEGGWASFVVSGAYVRDYEWSLIDPSGRAVIPVARLRDSYNMVEIKGNNSPKLNLYHIPYDLNGWKVVCDFIGAGEGNVKRSQPAVLTVNPTFSRVAAAPQPSPAVSASPAPEAVSATAPVTSSVTTAADAEEHSYSDTWSYDARGHWREALDGSAATDEALHSFTWTTVRPESDKEAGLEQGVCGICGYTATRRVGGPAQSESVSIPVPVSTDSSDSESGSDGKISLDFKDFHLSDLKPPSVVLALLMALLPVDLVLIIVHLCGSARQRRRRRRRR